MSSPAGSAGDGRSSTADAHVVRLLDEFLNRRAAGEMLSEEALLAAHPEYADQLREHLELVRYLRPRHQRIEELLALGTLLPSADETGPALLDEYHIHGVLGEGGMGVVLAGYDPRLNRQVALKVLRPDRASDPVALARFEREAKAAGALQHPNVVMVYSVGCCRGTRYIVMELIRGPSLAQVIDDCGPLPRAAAPGVFGQMLEGLAAAHRAGLIHRDIKSSNILLDRGSHHGDCESPAAATEAQSCCLRPVNLESSIVKIADFGLARMRSSQTQLTLGDSVLGTPEYMSPEQARGDAEIDHRTDLYSAGVVLYEMLTGCTPFKADTPTATIRRILDEEPQDPRRLQAEADPHLAALALRLMAKQPEDRIASATEALAALRTSERVRLPERWRRQRRRLAALSALVGLMAVVWAGWDFAGGPRRITAVRTDPDTRRAVQVQYGRDTNWYTLVRFPAGAGEVESPRLAELDGHGRQAVVAGLAGPWNGANLFAFDTSGDVLWKTYLHDETGRLWPDCAQSASWRCLALERGDLDGRPGDELVVAVSEVDEYPTRISIVDANSGQVRPGTTFWHMGNVQHILIAEEFFEDGHAAIVAWGVNNKLDGFETPPYQRPSRPAGWDIVSVFMVLDPVDMQGLGPPPVNLVPHIRAATPYAYALVDLAGDSDGRRVADAGPGQPAERYRPAQMTRELIGGIGGVTVLPADARPNQRGRFKIEIRWRSQDNLWLTRAYLRLARDLTLLDVVPVDGEENGRTKAYWDQYWRPVIQNREYVED